jgi:acetyl esterase/lipase
VSDRFRTASGVGAALTLNALRPVPSGPLAVPSFFTSWLTAELAPHNLAVTVLGTAAHLARRGVRTRDDRVGLVYNAVSAAGLAAIIVQSGRVAGIVEAALSEGLGPRYDARPKPPATDLATPWRQIALPFRMHDPEVAIERGVRFSDAGSRGTLDIYRPRSGGRGLPVLLQIHGGGWVIGRKDQQGIPLMLHLAKRGWVCVAPNYRLAPRSPWPAQLLDVKRALAWIRQHITDYGGDPAFVAVTGGSAGGHLAALVALTPNDRRYQPDFPDVDTSVQACIPHYGVYDFANSLGTKAGQDRLDAFLRPIVVKQDPRTHAELYNDATPLLLVGSHAPPFFVLHGARDSLVPVKEARVFVDRLREHSQQPVVYAELPGAQHAFDIFPSIRSAHVVRGVERFLRFVYEESGQVTEAGRRRQFA